MIHEEQRPNETVHKVQSLSGIDPNKTVQFGSLIVFFICALSLPAWWAFGILMINPLLAIIGLLSASTFWMMGWIAKRQIKQTTASSDG